MNGTNGGMQKIKNPIFAKIFNGNTNTNNNNYIKEYKFSTCIDKYEFIVPKDGYNLVNIDNEKLAFLCFLDDNIISKIVHSTNKYLEQHLRAEKEQQTK